MKRSVIVVSVCVLLGCLILFIGMLATRIAGPNSAGDGTNVGIQVESRNGKDSPVSGSSDSVSLNVQLRPLPTFEQIDKQIILDNDYGLLAARYANLCSLLKGVDLNGDPRLVSEHLQDPAWIALSVGCDVELVRSIHNALLSTNFNEIQDPYENLLRKHGIQLGSELSDEQIKQILAEVKLPDDVASLAHDALSDARMDALFTSLKMQPLAVADSAGRAEFRNYAAILVMCEVAGTCGGYEVRTLAECAAQPGCKPGTTMEQIVRMKTDARSYDAMRNYVEAFKRLTSASRS